MKIMSFLTIFCLLAGTSAGAGTISGKVEGKGLKKKTAIVYLADVQGEFIPPAKNPTMDQKNMTFIPHVLPVQVGTTVDFLNNDEVRHNVFSPDKQKYNLGTWPTGEIKQHTFTEKGVYSQLCNVHPEMEAFIVALDTPYFVTTEDDGSFVLNDVPAGLYTVKVWHEKLRFPKQEVQVTDTAPVQVDFAPRKRR